MRKYGCSNGDTAIHPKHLARSREDLVEQVLIRMRHAPEDAWTHPGSPLGAIYSFSLPPIWRLFFEGPSVGHLRDYSDLKYKISIADTENIVKAAVETARHALTGLGALFTNPEEELKELLLTIEDIYLENFLASTVGWVSRTAVHPAFLRGDAPEPGDLVYVKTITGHRFYGILLQRGIGFGRQPTIYGLFFNARNSTDTIVEELQHNYEIQKPLGGCLEYDDETEVIGKRVVPPLPQESILGLGRPEIDWEHVEHLIAEHRKKTASAVHPWHLGNYTGGSICLGDLVYVTSSYGKYYGILLLRGGPGPKDTIFGLFRPSDESTDRIVEEMVAAYSRTQAVAPLVAPVGTLSWLVPGDYIEVVEEKIIHPAVEGRRWPTIDWEYVEWVIEDHKRRKRSALHPFLLKSSRKKEGICPRCEENLTYSDTGIDKEYVWRNVRCPKCYWNGKEWELMRFSPQWDSGKELQSEGHCPECGGALEYSNWEPDDFGCFYDVDCMSCDWFGREFYDCIFIGFTDPAGNPKHVYETALHPFLLKSYRDYEAIVSEEWDAIYPEDARAVLYEIGCNEDEIEYNADSYWYTMSDLLKRELVDAWRKGVWNKNKIPKGYWPSSGGG